jgi:hypothetical protein
VLEEGYNGRGAVSAVEASVVGEARDERANGVYWEVQHPDGRWKSKTPLQAACIPQNEEDGKWITNASCVAIWKQLTIFVFMPALSAFTLAGARDEE